MRHARADRPHVNVEDQMPSEGDRVELTAEGGNDHRAGMRDLHAASDFMLSAGPGQRMPARLFL